jgi:cytochrome c2
MHGKKNPSEPRVWERTCGHCHLDQLTRVQSTLMTTNTGMIRNIRLTWEGEDGKLYGSQEAKTFDPEGKPVDLAGIRDLDHLSGELYRKFCALCHVGLESMSGAAVMESAAPPAISLTTTMPHCGGCHRVLTRKWGGLGRGAIGPNLSGLTGEFYPTQFKEGEPWTTERLGKWLENPRAIRPGARMPPKVPPDADAARLMEILGESGADATAPLDR